MGTKVVATVLVIAGLAVSGCTAGDRPATGQGVTDRVPPPAPAVNKPLETMGTNVELGPMSVLNVFVVPPRSEHYQAGQDAEVRLTLVNHGAEDALTGVSSPFSRSASIHWDRGCDGTAEAVDRLPVTEEGLVPRPTAAPEFRHSAYYVSLEDLKQEVLGTTIPVKFTFAHAGTVTVSAKVQPPERADVVAPLACLK